MAQAPNTAQSAAPANKPVVPPPAKPLVAPNAAVTPSGSAPVSAVAPPPFQINPIKRDSRYIKELIYGKHGLGKTTLGASAADVPEMSDVFMIDCESGDLSISDNERIVHHDKIMSARVNDVMTIGKIFEFLSAHCANRDLGTPEAEAKLRKMQDMITPEPLPHVHKFRTVLFDSLTEAEQYNMTALMGYTEAMIFSGADADAMEVSGWGEFRKNKIMIEYLIRKFRSLPMHLIVTCAEAYTEDEVKKKSYNPALTGQLQRSIQGPFDIVGHLMMGEKMGDVQPRLLRVKPDGRSAAKCRFSSFKGDGFQDPTQLKILTAVGLLGPRSS
jgi:AAA domain